MTCERERLDALAGKRRTAAVRTEASPTRSLAQGSAPDSPT